MLQVLCNLPHSILNASLGALDQNLWVLRSFVRRADARELGDLALARLLVEALWIAGFGDLERDLDVNLDEREGLIGGVGAG